jgi:FAD/FMN-containing dehydrogenase
MNPLISTLRAIVGAEHLLTEGDLSQYEQDWRKRMHGKALAVVRPANTAQVAAVVKACAAARAAGSPVSIVPQGGNTGMVVGSVPDTSGQQVVLSLQRMHAVRSLDAGNMAVTVEAGCKMPLRTRASCSP